MKTMKISDTLPDNRGPKYWQGRKDAYTERKAGATLPVLHHRSRILIALHPSDSYVAGYAFSVTKIQNKNTAAVDAQIELAYIQQTERAA
ncbi:hypothetical protein [Streptomyces cinereoruber]|uniref:hypothetical protein n=1 Tax=Streptomyces cinereoruber TaxID=67260 RepID=UPI00363DFA8E